MSDSGETREGDTPISDISPDSMIAVPVRCLRLAPEPPTVAAPCQHRTGPCGDPPPAVLETQLPTLSTSGAVTLRHSGALWTQVDFTEAIVMLCRYSCAGKHNCFHASTGEDCPNARGETDQQLANCRAPSQVPPLRIERHGSQGPIGAATARQEDDQEVNNYASP